MRLLSNKLIPYMMVCPSCLLQLSLIKHNLELLSNEMGGFLWVDLQSQLTVGLISEIGCLAAVTRRAGRILTEPPCEFRLEG